MKNYLLVGLLLLLSAFQMNGYAQMNKKEYEKQWICVGVKGGVSVSRMWYLNNKALNLLPQDILFHLTGGIFADVPLNNVLAVAPELTYAKRGTAMHYLHINSGSQVNYSLDVTYLDLRVPLEIRWPIRPYFQPYFVVGAEAGMRIGGQIHMDRKPSTLPQSMDMQLDTTINVGKANMSLFHAGAFAGVGIRSKLLIGRRYMLLKLSASYHQGLLDTYSKMEKNDITSSDAVNVNAYQINGMRWPQGLELTLGVAFSLKSMGQDACAAFSKDRYHRHGSHGRSFGY